MRKFAFTLILMMSPAAPPIAAQIRFEAPPIGAGDPPITVQKRMEEYTGTAFLLERTAEYAFVSLWSYASGTSLPFWADTKDYCERPSWELMYFSSIRDIDFVEPTKDEVEAIRSCERTKNDLRKATITMRDRQRRTVFLYTAGAFAKTADGERLWLGETRSVSRLSLK